MQRFIDVFPGIQAVGAEQQVVQDGQAAEQPPAFRDHGNFFLDDVIGWCPVDGAALQDNLPFFRMQEPGNGFDDGGLPGAVRADEADDFAFVDDEGNILDGQKPFIANGNIID